QPNHRNCIVSNGSGPKQAVNVTNVTVTCNNAYTIGGAISGVPGTGLVLQNNGGDNLQVASGVSSYTFSTPLATSAPYAVTVLSQPGGQDCTISGSSTGTVGIVDVTNVNINCVGTPAALPEDSHVYTADFGASTATSYTATGGALSARTTATAGAGPSSIAVDPAGKYAYVTNQTANTIKAYSITAGTSVLGVLADVDAGTAGTQGTIATGTTPVAITIHPSGKFAYVVNKISNSVSAYSIDASSGALARIDANGSVVGNQTTIPTRLTPVAIAIHPDGGYAYVANADDNSVSVYGIDTLTGALTAIAADGGVGSTYMLTNGTTPYSIKVDPSGQQLYVANRATDNVSVFAIGAVYSGALSTPSVISVTDNSATTPISVAIHPTKLFAYVVNSGNNTVNVYDTATPGSLIPKSFAPTGSLPISISIDRSGQYAYVANSGDSSVSAYSINATSGALSLVGTYLAGTSPYSVTTAP
ncbi:MAG: beta-propeller fold lactonase family protein, partial [Gallionella sp.]